MPASRKNSLRIWLSNRIGIRLALGAPPARIGLAFQSRALLLTAGGILAGAWASYGLRKALDLWLFRTSSTDPAIWMGLGAVLLGVALAAAAVPAWRAARRNPAEALRVD